MNFPRSAGILLHPSSLPGPFGIGTMGAEARAFVDFLADSGQNLCEFVGADTARVAGRRELREHHPDVAQQLVAALESELLIQR